MTYREPFRHSRVMARTVEVCANCGRPWIDHLPKAREFLRRDQPERFYFGPAAGIEYPTTDSLVVQSNVTTEACEALNPEYAP